jgi:transposase
MERELWSSLYRILCQLDKPYGSWLYSTSDVLAVYFWAVIHDRPVNWAAEKENWPEDLRPSQLPSQSTLSRRMRQDTARRLMSEVEAAWSAAVNVCCYRLLVIDGKGLTVSGVSKDADAGYGRAAGGMAKGYKFFAVWGGGPLPVAWALGPMHKSEKTMARQLIPDLEGYGYLLGDVEYDCNPLYDLAEAAGYHLLTPKRLPKSKGLGHRPQSPARLRAIAMMKQPFAKELFKQRRQIERDFGALTCFGGGLGPLPAWVRRFTRVRNWIHAKLLVNAARWLRKQQTATLALA